MIFYDTETCGLYGMPVLIQWAEDDGPIKLYSPWTEPIKDTLKLIKYFMEHEGGIVGFNLTFDHFMLCKLYTVFSARYNHDDIPMDIIDELAELEMDARDGPCLKPVKACDLMLHARKGPYQSTMDRGDIRIKRVPTAIAWQLASELDRRIPLKDIYFARKKDKSAQRWQVYDIEDEEGIVNPDFKDIVLKFAASSGLKALATDALNLPVDEVLMFMDIEVDEHWYPEEFGFAPFAKANGGNRLDWKGAWPEKIKHHINHWNYHDLARKYAGDDVDYTRRLYYHFGSPELGDDDSELACMVAAVRWRGFRIDIQKLQQQRLKALQKIGKTPMAPQQVRNYVNSKLAPTEELVLRGSTKKILLEEVAKLKKTCPKCNPDLELSFKDTNADLVADFDAPSKLLEVKIKNIDKNCPICNGKGEIAHPAAQAAQEVLDARAATKEVEIFDKLIQAGRFHVSLNIIGALSSRMSGSDGLNAQGIKKTDDVRSCFLLAWAGMILSGGDFSGFEVTLAEACYKDPGLRKDLLTCEYCEGGMEFVFDKVNVLDYIEDYTEFVIRRNEEEISKHKKSLKAIDAAKLEGKTPPREYTKKTEEDFKKEAFENNFYCKSCGCTDGKAIHALFGVNVFPDMSYDELKATKGSLDDKYTRCKQAVFAMFYGGEGKTLQDRLGVDIDTANEAFEKFTRKYPGVGRARQKIFNLFCSMRQPGGIGSKVEWHEPADKIESMLGFPRYFTLENRICKTLFEIANKPPKSWQDIKIKVMRRDREQTIGGAAQSAIYAAAFAIQASNMRAGANHEIQSTGAQITKRTQRKIWDIQPSGISKWLVQPFNIHDEIMAPCLPEVADLVKQAVKDCVESFRPKIPLIRMDWQTNLKSWAEKG